MWCKARLQQIWEADKIQFSLYKNIFFILHEKSTKKNSEPFEEAFFDLNVEPRKEVKQKQQSHHEASLSGSGHNQIF